MQTRTRSESWLVLNRVLPLLVAAPLTVALVPGVARAESLDTVGYNVASWSSGGVTMVTSDTTTWEGDSGTWYVVIESVTISNRVTVKGTPNLVLSDGATLTVPKGITVSKGNTLTIQGTGKLEAGNSKDNTWNAAIGGTNGKATGTIIIKGGTVTATAGKYAAGIGGGYKGGGGTVEVSGGTVTATGGNDGASIGGGNFGAGGTVTISGGTVTAQGGGSGAGIGSGYTASAGERDLLVKAGWNDEGKAWKAPGVSSTPVWRLYNKNGSDHHYTTSAGERDLLVEAAGSTRVSAGTPTTPRAWRSSACTTPTPRPAPTTSPLALASAICSSRPSGTTRASPGTA